MDVAEAMARRGVGGVGLGRRSIGRTNCLERRLLHAIIKVGNYLKAIKKVELVSLLRTFLSSERS